MLQDSGRIDQLLAFTERYLVELIDLSDQLPIADFFK